MDLNLSKLRIWYFVPVWGVIIHFMYIYIKKYNDHTFSKKILFKFQLLIGLSFFIGFVFIALIMRLINALVNNQEFLNNYGVYIASIFSGYLTNIPCKMYIKKYIEK